MGQSDILGVVLAGGASRRLGRDKAGLPWTGTTLVRRAAAVLAEACGEVVVAGPAGSAPVGVEAVPDRFAGRGPLAGLHSGLERAGGRPIFALACDLPFVETELVRHLLAVARERTRRGAGEGAWAAAEDGAIQPLCGIWAPAARAAAAARLDAGELAVRGLFEAVGGVAVPLTAELGFYRPELLLNVNRPDDLRRARRLRGAAAGAAR